MISVFKMGRADWELAEMVDNAGRIGKAVPAGRILVPGLITLDNDSLHWRVTDKSRVVVPDPSILNGFVQLWNKPHQAVLGFARRWGVLAIGEHNRPSVEGIAGVDSLEAWHFFSRRAMAVLNLIASLKQGKIGDITDWRELGTVNDSLDEFSRVGEVALRFPLPQFTGFPETVRQSGDAIADEVNAWMAVWRGQRLHAVSDFRVDYTGPGLWEMQVDFHGYLFAALAFQLCLVTVNADSLYCCSGCGWPYVRPRRIRRPRAGQANYCGKCAELGIPIRRASERYRERKANAQTKTRER